jgi:hypothetical protein
MESDVTRVDEKERALWQKIRSGEDLSPEEQAFLDQRSQARSAFFQAKKASLRVGDSARAQFFRLKDEKLASFGPVLAALHRYSVAKKQGTDERPVVDEDGEALFRGYGLLRWVMMTLDEDEQDADALEIARQCFDAMAPICAAFIPRWL